MEECIFCKIINKDLRSDTLHETERLVIIKDIMPKAPVHLLVIPKQHIESVTDIGEADAVMIGELVVAAKEIAEQQGIAESGYKLVFNVGRDGGQVVKHIHLHLLGGKQLAE